VRFAVLCVTIILGGSIGTVSAKEGPLLVDQTAPRSISIAVFLRPDIPDSLVTRICNEAQAIWRPAGIRFAWRRVRQSDQSMSDLEVTIDDERRAVRDQEALGWITFRADGPERSIHLSLASTEDLLRTIASVGDMPIVTHDTLIGRALGRALAHELGHYLLKSQTHAPRGLMQATRPSDRFFAVSRREFELTVQEREASAASSVQIREDH